MKTVTMSRELAEKVDDVLYIMTGEDSYQRLVQKYGTGWWGALMEMRAELRGAIAAPVVERQPTFMKPQYLTVKGLWIECDESDPKAVAFFASPPAPVAAELIVDHKCPLCGDPAGHMGWVCTRQAAPVAVVLPERKSYEESFSVHGQGQIMGWNACLDKVKELNQ